MLAQTPSHQSNANNYFPNAMYNIYNRSWVVIVARSKKTVMSRDEEKLMSNFSINIRDKVISQKHLHTA